MTYPDLALDDAAADAEKLIASLTDIAQLGRIEKFTAGRAAQIRAAGRAAAIAECHAIARNYGMTVAQLIGQPAVYAKRAPRPARYRHPDGREWSGAGRAPKWYKDWEQSDRPMSEITL